MFANSKQLYKDVDFLTSIQPPRNYKNLKSLETAVSYIEKEFKNTGLLLTTQTWEAKGNEYKNIIASFQPEKKQRFVVGAHYDVYKEVPGADDNASGVAAILEIARLLKKHNTTIDYGIDLVAFCLEEPPFFKTKQMGSYIHAKSAYEEGQNIIGMISIEMIGFYRSENSPSIDDKNYLFVSGIKKFDAFNWKISQLLKEKYNLGSRRVSYADNYRNNGPSDHRNYWEFNYPAVMIIGSGNEKNPNYHKSSDTIDTLDFKIMTQAVNSIFYAILNYRSVDN